MASFVLPLDVIGLYSVDSVILDLKLLVYYVDIAFALSVLIFIVLTLIDNEQ